MKPIQVEVNCTTMKLFFLELRALKANRKLIFIFKCCIDISEPGRANDNLIVLHT